MKISPVSFKKTLVKDCYIPTNKNCPTLCAIYKLDLPEDSDYFSKVQCDEKWDKNRFLNEIDESIQITVENENNYVLENSKGDCLGYICTSDDKHNKIKEVLFLETCPHYANANPKRGLKYIGETLLSYIVELADKNDVDCVSIPIVSRKAIPFYTDKCGFKQDPEDISSKILYKKDFQKLINQNKEHTSIEKKQKKLFSIFKTKKGD